MRRVAAAVGLVLLAGAPACAHPSHLGVAPAYPVYGPAPYAALPWNRVGGAHHHHAAPRRHHGGGHGARHHGSGGHHVAPNHGHHRPHHQPHHQQRRH